MSSRPSVAFCYASTADCHLSFACRLRERRLAKEHKAKEESDRKFEQQVDGLVSAQQQANDNQKHHGDKIIGLLERHLSAAPAAAAAVAVGPAPPQVSLSIARRRL